MRCLFFGASGYLGRHLVNTLNQTGHEVIIPLTKNGDRLDLSVLESLANIDWNVDVVYMFAGVTGTGASFEQYKRFLLGNELSLLNVLDSIRRSSARPRVIFPSTRLVYRGSDSPLTENAVQESKTPYSANKIACENYIHAYSNAFDVPYTVLRICIPFASELGQEYSYGTVGNFISQAQGTGRIRIYGDGSVRRTFSHIQDLCRITLLATELPSTINKTYNMPGDELSLYDAASLIASRFGAVVESVDWPELDARLESGSTVFDSTHLLETIQTVTHHRFCDWAAKIPSLL
ncbi:NAD-dependent epimerase/dehydratase family protein [Pandoraea sp.]|uniref:NAD-dependent epimerase/dehydratase family protein n=1 Tax=Pandoraea sp. TaxID=1883445 RepID=UPI0035B39372